MNKERAEKIVDRIINGYNPLKIIIFGSYARGEATEFSDLDLLIVKDTTESFYKRPALIRSLFDKQPGPMDILVFTPDEFDEQKSEINNIVNIAVKSGIVVYEQSA